MPKILIMPTPLRQRPGRFRALLQEAGFTPIDPPGTAKLDDAALRQALPESDALLAWGGPITASMIASAPRLRAIARSGAGHDAVDVAAATARGIAVSNTPGANAESVAEQVFALLLCLTRNILGNDQSIRAGRWERRPVRPLRGTTFGIVGLGQSGRAVARRALTFGMRVVACGRASQESREMPTGITRLALEELLAVSDVVSLHLPLNAATRGLFDRRLFELMRPGAIFLNAARGGLVVEADLIESLQAGKLAGAGLDVLSEEPPSFDNRLLAMQNVVLSPHIGGSDSLALDEMAERAAQCVIDLFEGRWPDGSMVNEELRDGWRW